MQLSLINFLFGTTFSGNGAHGAKGGDGDLFSQLLGDSAQGNNGQAQAGLKGSDIAASALLAQEINPQQLAMLQNGQGDQLAKLLEQKIGPEQARAMIDQLNAMSANGEGSQEPAFDQLKESLEDIEANGEPVEVANLLDSLPAVADVETPAERAPLMQRMLGWVQTALDRQKEAMQQAAMVQDSTALSLQASLFRASDDANQAAAAQAADDDAKEKAAKTVTQIVPLAQPMMVAMPEWVRKLGDDAKTVSTDSAIDEAIPPLSLASDPEEKDALPKVNLPGANDIATTDTTVDDKPVARAVPAFAEHLRPLQTAMDEQDATSAPVTQISGLQGASALHSTNSVHNASNPHAAASAAYTPHVPVSEQVHVAITQGMKDGIDQITLQLDPADLGRVEVKMDMAADGKAQLSFLVDKADTLDALSRDARGLERMLQEAGVKADAGSMQFNLRQQPQPQFSADMGGQGQAQGQPANDNDEEDHAALSLPVGPGGMTTHYTLQVRDGVDIRA